MTEDRDRFLEKLVRLYIAARDLMDGTAGPIRRLIDEGDVVYGVWPDAIKPHGIDYGVLKGGELLETAAVGWWYFCERLWCRARVGIKHFRYEQCFAALIFIETIDPIIPCATSPAASRCLPQSVGRHCGSITSRGIDGRHLRHNR
jgi:hypothetical protein